MVNLIYLFMMKTKENDLNSTNKASYITPVPLRDTPGQIHS